MAALFEVLAEPHRRSILDLLRESERSVTDLVGVEVALVALDEVTHLRISHVDLGLCKGQLTLRSFKLLSQLTL